MTDRNTRPDTRQRLILAGVAIFAANGFTGTTTRMLADKAQVNLSAIPYYFRSKEGLYLATIEYIAEVLGGLLDPCLGKIQAMGEEKLDAETARDLLKEGLDTMVAVMCGDPGTMPFSQIILREQMAPSAAFDVIYPRVMGRILNAFATLIAAITGETDERQCNLQAVLFIGQVMVWRAGRATVMRRVGMAGYTAAEIAEIQETVFSRAMAALDFMAGRRA